MSPSRPLRPCAAPGCPSLVQTGRCPAHGGTGQPERSWARPSAYAGQRTRGSVWMAIRATVMREEPCCYKCGGLGQPSDMVDHLVPLSQGGTDDRHNLARCCRRCHAHKTAAEAARAR